MRRWLAMRGALFAATAALAVAGMLAVASAEAQPGPPHGRGGGWGPHGTWGRHWDASTVETLSGTVVSISKITPYSGMSQGVHVELRTERETISVHLGPAWYLDNQELALSNIGQEVKVTGEVDGTEIKVASIEPAGQGK